MAVDKNYHGIQTNLFGISCVFGIIIIRFFAQKLYHLGPPWDL